MEILNSKEIILEKVDFIFQEYQNNLKQTSNQVKEAEQRVCELTELNTKLINEISEKDKLLIINDKKMLDYETMINKIQEDAMKELSEKERFSMLKAKDKAIDDRDIEIRRLQKKVDLLEEKLIKNDNINIVVEEKNDEWKKQSQNSLIKEDKKVEKALKHYSNHIGKKVTLEELGLTSIGINGWYEDSLKNKSGFLVEKMKEVIDHQKEEEIETEVIDPPKEEEIETEVIDPPNEDDGGTTEDLTSEEESAVEVEIITHYKKEFYIRVGENPQYIYAIEDGVLGDKVGELINGKKKFYKSSKK